MKFLGKSYFSYLQNHLFGFVVWVSIVAMFPVLYTAGYSAVILTCSISFIALWGLHFPVGEFYLWFYGYRLHYQETSRVFKVLYTLRCFIKSVLVVTILSCGTVYFPITLILIMVEWAWGTAFRHWRKCVDDDVRWYFTERDY